MKEKFDILEYLLIDLHKALTEPVTKKEVRSKQYMKLDGSVNVGDGSMLNISQYQQNIVSITDVQNLEKAIAIIGDLKQFVPCPDNPLQLALQNYKRYSVEKALEKTNGNKFEAAKLLGMSYRSIRYEKLKMDKAQLEL